jgi:hypothetical protein
MRLHFITFADGTNPKYMIAAKQLADMIFKAQIFSTLKVYTKMDLMHDEVFWTQHKDFFARSPRGFGYWLWKSYIVWKRLQEVDEGDIVLYCDACTSFHSEAKERFLQYLEMLHQSPHKSFFIQMSDDLPLRHWTKADTIHRLNAKELLDLPIVMATILMVANTQFNRSFFQFLYSVSCEYSLLDDSPSERTNDPTFREHRHDQSILSILVYKLCSSSIVSIPGEWYFPKNEPERKQFPFQIQSNAY